MMKAMEESAQRVLTMQLKQIEAFEKGYGLKNLNVSVSEWENISNTVKLMIMHLQGEVEDMEHQMEQIREHLDRTPV